MKSRFEGIGNNNRIDALKRQEFVSGNIAIASALDKVGTVVEFDRDEALIVQNDADNDIYLLLAGSVLVVANGAEVGQRKAGQHVGEMSAIEPSLPRSANVVAVEKTVALRISSTDFLKVGEEHPTVWLPMARELARRLYQRNSMIPQPNEAPKLFIISSSEAIAIANCYVA
jgi:CRP/FNR family cyclic AMP-dependent transcriptional regulator